MLAWSKMCGMIMRRYGYDYTANGIFIAVPSKERKMLNLQNNIQYSILSSWSF